jgi:hypothetical protein
MIDRSLFLEELKRNPVLMSRLATIVNGEVGRGASLDQKLVQLETIFNRAQARGQSLEQVTQMYTGPGSRGYYPQSTFTNGAVRSQNEQNAFNEQVLKPVLSGSDRSTDLLGFAATGNASGGVAQRGIASGRYTAHGKVGPETYVQEGRFDNIARLHGYRKGERPTPPADIPNPGGETYDKGTAPVAMPGAGVTRSPAAGLPSLITRALPSVARAVRPPPPSLGDQIIKAMGPRGALMSSFTDPTTGQQYLQGGSGEEAMGVMRAIGRPSQSVRPAPAQRQRPVPTPPQGQGAAGVVNPQPRGPVPPTTTAPDTSGVTSDEMQRRPLMPFDPRMFDTTPTAAAVPTNLSGLLPRSQPPMTEDPVGMFDVKRVPPLPLTAGGMPTAPEIAGLLAPEPPPSVQQPADSNLASAGFLRGGKSSGLEPPYYPTTVGQQIAGGLSPFMVTPPTPPSTTPTPNLSPFSISPQQSGFASTTLLPFDQWPSLDFGSFNWAGPYNFNAWG